MLLFKYNSHLMSKIFVVYSHYNEKSFNYAIRETFIKNAQDAGHTVDLVDLLEFTPLCSR